jgi:hypothetical protein
LADPGGEGTILATRLNDAAQWQGQPFKAASEPILINTMQDGTRELKTGEDRGKVIPTFGYMNADFPDGLSSTLIEFFADVMDCPPDLLSTLIPAGELMKDERRFVADSNGNWKEVDYIKRGERNWIRVERRFLNDYSFQVHGWVGSGPSCPKLRFNPFSKSKDPDTRDELAYSFKVRFLYEDTAGYYTTNLQILPHKKVKADQPRNDYNVKTGRSRTEALDLSDIYMDQSSEEVDEGIKAAAKHAASRGDESEESAA